MKLYADYRKAIKNALKSLAYVQNCRIQREEKPVAHLRVYLELVPEEASFIRVEIRLPEDWNGKFIGCGNGGMAGTLPTGGILNAVENGCVGVTTDMGTSCGKESGIQNPAVWKDFGHRATHLMTVIGKAVTEAAFNEKPACSVFYGGSTGGEQALSLAERYPDDYDAIFCGAPANNRVCLHTYFMWNAAHLKNARREPLFDEPTATAIHEKAIAFAQAHGDGEPNDRFVSFPIGDIDYLDAFIEQTVRELNLTEEQKAALQAVYHGPVHSVTGKRIYNGYPLGSELYSCGLLNASKTSLSGVDYPFYWGLGADTDPLALSFGTDFDRVFEQLSPEMDATTADLSAFFARGGKLLMISGSADACVPWQDAWSYARRVEDATDRELLEKSFRFYLAPSLDHRIAGGGSEFIVTPDGRDMLTLLFDWANGQDVPQDMKVFVAGYQEESTRERLIHPLVPSDGRNLPYPPTCDKAFWQK